MRQGQAPRRGDVWIVEFSDPIGTEAAYQRLAIVVGNTAANESAAVLERAAVTVVRKRDCGQSMPYYACT